MVLIEDKGLLCSLAEDRLIHGGTWAEVAQKYGDATGVLVTPDACRHAYARICRSGTRDENEQLLLEMKKLRVKISDERVQNNALVRQLAREETLREIAREVVADIETRVKLQPSESHSHSQSEKEAILQLSDWHYGILVDNFLNQYNPEIARQRVQSLCDQVVSKCLREGVKTIHVVNLGDLISGRIHLTLRLQSRIDIITQTMDVCEIVAQMLTILAENFDVEYYDTLDNHSRVEPSKGDSLHLESMVRVITWYLKERLRGVPRVRIHDDNHYGKDIAVFQVLGHEVIGVHGDKEKPHHLVEALTLFTKKHYDLVLTAHMHHFSADEKNETLVVANASLMGTDEYAKDLRLNSKPSQNLLISTKENVMETLYRIVLD